MTSTSAPLTIDGRTGPWEIVIGLETHAQVTSRAKLFSGASTEFAAPPNAQVSFVDAGFPGMLPVINQLCIDQAVRTGLGLDAKINLRSVFDRKNYFYADLPAGYQISQYLTPVVGQGRIMVDLPGGRSREVGITRLHLEQDAGKSLHDQHPAKTYVDLNRSGVALMEIVSEPDMRSAEEAGAYVKKLRSILRYLGTCDGNMDEGSMRCDVNVSVRRPGEALGTRCEIKNVNSIRFIQQAIDYEARRQVDVLEGGGAIRQETRLFDSAKGETRPMRGKEHAHDYRYFPDPDLPPLEFDQAYVERLRAALPELPDAKKARFISSYGLSPYDAAVLVAEKETADYYEAVVLPPHALMLSLSKHEGLVLRQAQHEEPGKDLILSLSKEKIAANWVMGELFGLLNKAGKDITESPVSPASLGGLLDLIADGTISGKIAKEVFALMFETGESAAGIVEKKGLRQVTDSGAIDRAIDEILAAHAGKVAEYRAGKDKLFGFFVGQVMKATGGKANPALLNERLTLKLKE